MSADDWCPLAVHDPISGATGAGELLAGRPKIVHHTTEGSTYQGAHGAYLHSHSIPHFTDTFEGGKYKVWQHLPVNVSATALKHSTGQPETNRANCVQIEHVWFAAEAHRMPAGFLDGIGALCRWIEARRGVPRVAPYPFPGPRLTWPQWGVTAGHLGHLHVPGNDHTDPGAIDIGRILAIAPAGTVPSPSVPPVAILAHGTLEGVPVHIQPVSISTDPLGDGSILAPPGFLTVMPAGSHDKYDDAIPADKRDTDSIVVPVGARQSGGGFRLVVAGGPKSTTVGALVLVSD